MWWSMRCGFGLVGAVQLDGWRAELKGCLRLLAISISIDSGAGVSMENVVQVFSSEYFVEKSR